jgi:hypothetical protein
MKRSDDYAAMVKEADVTDSQKTVAMSYVASLRPLENGSAGSVKAVSNALVNQAAMLLEMYLHRPVSPAHVAKAVSTAVEKHGATCIAGELGKVVAGPQGKAGTMVALVKAGGLPAVFIMGLVKFGPELKLLLAKWIGS